MNVLFANYGDFTTNSLNHIGAFANQLTLAGHACAVAVPDGLETVSVVPAVLFKPVTFATALAAEPVFPDRRPADVLHVWTPREVSREFTLAYLHQHPGVVLIIHLEDNEQFLMESFAHTPLAELRQLSDEALLALLTPRLSHPVRFRNFLRLAHGVTCITERLSEFVPAGKPTHRLLPGIDPTLYHPLPPDPGLRTSVGLKPGEKAIVYTGSTNFANLADVRSLILAVRQINERGHPCKLIRTGINPPQLAQELAAIGGEHVIDLGFVAKQQLPPLLALADVLVQPGAPDNYNDYRLPSKLPEFLAMGRPVVTPRANIARQMEDGRHALLLDAGSSEEIVANCLRVFSDEALVRRLAAGAVEFARAHFDLAANSAGLAGFYGAVRSGAAPFKIVGDLDASEDVLLAEGDLALRMLAKERSIAGLRDRLAAAEANFSASRVHIGNLDAMLVALRAENTACTRQISSLNDEIQSGRAFAEKLTANLDALQAEQSRLAALAAEQAAGLAVGRAEISALRADLSASRVHIRNLEAMLESLRTDNSSLSGKIAALTEQLQSSHAHAGQLMAALTALEGEKSRLAAQSAALASDLAVERGKTSNLETGLVRLRTAADESMARLARDLDAARAATSATAATLRLREEKLERMARTFSWRATSPLRWLRRKFIDARPTAATSDGAPLPRPDDSLIVTVDQPADWSALLPQGTFRGWVLARNNTALAGVRAVVGGKVIEGRYGLARPDVAHALPELAHARTCGFSIDYSLPPLSDQSVVIEVLSPGGTWRCVAARIAHILAEIPEHLRSDYDTWVKRFDTLSASEIAAYDARLAALPPAQRPLISILFPTYNTPEPWLSKAIESVRAQLYPHWELCVADDASTDPKVRPLLEDYARRDPRIKLTLRSENGHISAASNSALDLATGAFTALLDHDDELAPHALAEIVLALAARPGLEFIYTDEDKIDDQGRRFDPYFKPDWNPDLLLGQNYTCHLSVFRTERLRTIGGFRAGYEGSQDWDLTLRATTGLEAARIHHIPRVLYHWRAIPGSTALIIDQKSDYPFIAAQKALRDHLARTGVTAELVAVSGRHWRVQRPLPAAPPKVSIIIPTRNAEHLLRLSVGSVLAKTAYPDFEVIVVNNRSDDPATLAHFAELRAAGVRVLDHDAPFNFSAINNFAAREARGELLAFLNNDLEVISPDWLAEMAAQALRPEIGAVGAMLYYPNDTVQHAGVVLGLTGPALRDGVAGHAFKCAPRGSAGQRNRLRLVQNYSAVTAACLVVRRATFEAVGGFNEADLAVAFNDIDFCLRVRAAGLHNLWTPFAEFYHHESATRGAEDSPEKIARFQRETAYMRHRWGDLLDHDPAYNPNLSLQHEDFSLAFPPRP